MKHRSKEGVHKLIPFFIYKQTKHKNKNKKSSLWIPTNVFNDNKFEANMTSQRHEGTIWVELCIWLWQSMRISHSRVCELQPDKNTCTTNKTHKHVISLDSLVSFSHIRTFIHTYIHTLALRVKWNKFKQEQERRWGNKYGECDYHKGAHVESSSRKGYGHLNGPHKQNYIIRSLIPSFGI